MNHLFLGVPLGYRTFPACGSPPLVYSFFFVVVARRAGVEEAEDPCFFRPNLIVFDRESIADLNPAFSSVPRCPWIRAGGRNCRKDEDNARGN